jgi:hypothetical protein
MNAWFLLIECGDALHTLVEGVHRAFIYINADGDVELVDEAQGAVY